MAAATGLSAESIAGQLLTRSLNEEAHFFAEVQSGIDEADRGELLEPSEVWARIEKVPNRR